MINYKLNEKYFKQDAPAGILYKITFVFLSLWIGVYVYGWFFNKKFYYKCGLDFIQDLVNNHCPFELLKDFLGIYFFPFVLPVAILVSMFLLKHRHSIFRPSYKLIEAQVQELFKWQRQGALRSLGLEEEELAAKPFLLWGYNFWGNYSQHYGHYGMDDVKGKDGRWRSPEIRLISWFFTEDRVIYYIKTISLVWYGCDKERTNSFFYRDISSVRKESTSSETKFIVTNHAGETLVCSCTDAELVEQAVMALQNLIKEKKR